MKNKNKEKKKKKGQLKRTCFSRRKKKRRKRKEKTSSIIGSSKHSTIYCVCSIWLCSGSHNTELFKQSKVDRSREVQKRIVRWKKKSRIRYRRKRFVYTWWKLCSCALFGFALDLRQRKLSQAIESGYIMGDLEKDC